ncbi:hydantoinase/oxoprolinase family protein [Polynucleobacter rarus]|uniref:hydantoinase/oxoprolinase family protein n=1 Tax=Polynucleobacter rarus TaxID=556055 RepID=UPI000D3EA64C|nr:hydantoinase/oxoprolinase family protein [Polynucleobacter rarus]
MNWSIGIDIGGTFTDIVACHLPSQKVESLKVLTTNSNPIVGVTNGLNQLITNKKITPEEIFRIVHATTLFTNALIERKGACTGLITNQGFKDIIEIGNERKYDLYDLAISRPDTLVPRNLRGEISGRIDARGFEIEKINEAQALSEVERLIHLGVESIAICLLHSYANSMHEETLVKVIKDKYPNLALTISSEISPIIREFERMTTTIANAYIQPIALSYLNQLESTLSLIGIQAEVLMMLSNGGLNHLNTAKSKPIALLESGPAAGVVAAGYFGMEEGISDLLAFDMGGTTAKLCLINESKPSIAYSFEAARQKRFTKGSGIPVNITTIELIEIGAGGGSIAHQDELNLLQVGPQSASSEPGPACYGLGGDQATVTDANLFLGYINPDYFAGGTIPINSLAAERALNQLAHVCNSNRTQIAWGIHHLVAENMATAARLHVAEQGRDPRNFVLLATGGGGPLHAYMVAKAIGISTIICPRDAGVASAFGLLIAPARADRSKTISYKPDFNLIQDLEKNIRDLESEIQSDLQALNGSYGPIQITYQAEARFVGQGFNLLFKLPIFSVNNESQKMANQEIKDTFLTQYTEKFGRTPPNGVIELVNLRIAGIAPPIQKNPVVQDKKAPSNATPKFRQVFFQEIGDFTNTPIFKRSELDSSFEQAGPLLIEEYGTTIVVGPLGFVKMSNHGNLIITISDNE